MKPISAHFDRIEKAYERFAWWPVRSSFSQELIWMRKYVELHIFFDDQGRPPIKARNWKLTYTSHEYFLKKLSN